MVDDFVRLQNNQCILIIHYYIHYSVYFGTFWIFNADSLSDSLLFPSSYLIWPIFFSKFIALLNYSGIEALGKVRGAAASMGHSFLKRVREVKDGVPLEKVAGNM